MKSGKIWEAKKSVQDYMVKGLIQFPEQYIFKCHIGVVEIAQPVKYYAQA